MSGPGEKTEAALHIYKGLVIEGTSEYVRLGEYGIPIKI